MTLTARRATALLLGIVLGWLFGLAVVNLKAQDDDEGIVVYYPGICLVLERHTKWWIFFECERFDAQLLAETVVVMDVDGERTTHVTREHADGSVRTFVRRQKTKR